MLKELPPSERLSDDKVRHPSGLLLQIEPPECHALLKNFIYFKHFIVKYFTCIFLVPDAPMTAFIPLFFVLLMALLTEQILKIT